MAHRERPAANYPCLQCDRLFVNLGVVRRRATMYHNRLEAPSRRIAILCVSHVCPWCSFRFKNTGSLKQHIATRDIRHECPISSKGSRVPPLPPKTLQCPPCRWNADFLNVLLNHVRENEKHEECQLENGEMREAERVKQDDECISVISSWSEELRPHQRHSYGHGRLGQPARPRYGRPPAPYGILPTECRRSNRCASSGARGTFRQMHVDDVQ